MAPLTVHFNQTTLIGVSLPENQYMKIDVGGQLDPDRNASHFATVPGHCFIKKKIPMKYSIGTSYL